MCATLCCMTNPGTFRYKRNLITFLCLLFLFIVLLFHVTSTKPGITDWDAPFEPNPSRCEYLLGILTIPSHSSLRSAMRNSWITDLPKHVCYAFLYDKPGYIPVEEKFDSISINATHEGKAVRFGEKIYRYYSYVKNNPKLENVKFVVKMDDDAVLCPRQLFEYLDVNNLTTKSYLGWFHNIETWNSKVDYDHGADEMFVLLGRDLVNRIINKTYCELDSKKDCDSLGQLYDTNYGGTSLGIWLSTMTDLNPLPMNDVFDHMNSNKRLKPEKTLLFHTAKTPKIAKEKYSNCQKIL